MICVVPLQSPVAMRVVNEIKYLVGYQTQNRYGFGKQMDHIMFTVGIRIPAGFEES